MPRYLYIRAKAGGILEVRDDPETFQTWELRRLLYGKPGGPYVVERVGYESDKGVWALYLYDERFTRIGRVAEGWYEVTPVEARWFLREDG
jgi:hypothetical protein